MIEDTRWREQILKAIPSAQANAEKQAKEEEMFRNPGDAPTSPFFYSAEQLEKFVEMARKIEDARGRAKQFQMVASFQVKAGKNEDALKTLIYAAEAAHEIENAVEKATVLGEIASKMDEPGNTKRAFATFKQAVEAASKSEQTSRKKHILGQLAMQLTIERVVKKGEERVTRVQESGGQSVGVLFRMKNNFNPAEQQLAKKIINELQAASRFK
jgi:hypothetical protein